MAEAGTYLWQPFASTHIMRISWNWLKQYIPAEITVEQAADILTSTGLEVEGVELVEPVPGMLKGVVVGEVLEKGSHPDADRLNVCQVDVAIDGPLNIVCGAPNVEKGQKVLVATVGATLHPNDGSQFKIKKSKIRGVESMGMICAEDELGLGTNHEGIMVLPETARVGCEAATHFNLQADHVMEIGLTPNRSDALGHIGVARDLLAALNFRKGEDHKLNLPSVHAFAPNSEDLVVKVIVEDEVACPRYAGCSLSNIVVGPSPDWLQQRLLSIGLKPINNVVDVTNFVQHETGQPLHAFDLDQVADHRIIVKQLPDKTTFTTLDENERELDEADLMICDPKGGLCIAGVFGGLHSGVTDVTTKVFLESAIFDPTSIRKTAKRHSLHTDASFRFERSVDPEMTIYALERAALLLREIAGATISSPVSDHYPRSKEQATVTMRYTDINSLSGQEIANEDVERILELLDMPVQRHEDDHFSVQVPLYRADVTRPADVAEEVMRIYGFDRIELPDTLRVPILNTGADNPREVRKAVATTLAARGFQEIMAPSLNSAATAVLEGGTPVVLANPLSSELDVMRTSMLPGMLHAVVHNLNRQRRDLRFFEDGHVYRIINGNIIEQQRVALLITGAATAENWREKRREADLFDVKEELELTVANLLPQEMISIRPAQHGWFIDHAEVLTGESTIGRLGQVSSSLLKDLSIPRPVFYAELWPSVIAELRSKRDLELNEVPRFPAVRRDLSMLVDDQVTYQQLRDLAMKTERSLLQEVGLFDVYQGDKLPDGKKSYAMSFILQDPTKTLTDRQVDKVMARIQEAFQRQLGVELRG